RFARHPQAGTNGEKSSGQIKAIGRQTKANQALIGSVAHTYYAGTGFGPWRDVPLIGHLENIQNIRRPVEIGISVRRTQMNQQKPNNVG
ncbi:hypothetical protein R0J89_18050, partial [Psychrobacter sp. SIMBA_152]